VFGHSDNGTKQTAAGMAMIAAPTFLAGALVGAGLALLLAPARGDETRDLIGRKMSRLGREARHRFDDAGDKMNEKAEALGQSAREAVDQVGDALRGRPGQAQATTPSGSAQRPV